MAFLAAAPAPAQSPAKTGDMEGGFGAPLNAKSVGRAGSSGAPSRMREHVKGPSSAAPDRRLGRGGAPRLPCFLEARKRGTWSLSERQAANLGSAADWAVDLNLPLNRFVTINWEAGGVADCTKATGRFLKYAGDWLRRHGQRIAYVWVQERGHRVGQHVHMLVHVPADLSRRFSELQRRWLRCCGATFRKGLIKSRPVGRSHRTAVPPAPLSYRCNLQRVLRYLLKQSPSHGASPATRSSACRSLVLGKRCATSENIGAAARSRARKQ